MPDPIKPTPSEGVGPETFIRALALTRIAPADGADANTPVEFDAVMSTGAAVRRYDWSRDRFVLEVLDMNPAAVDIERMNGGASVLDSHRTYGLDAVFGNVVPGSVRLESGALKARLRFDPQDPRSRKVVEGFVRGLSVGYTVSRWEIDENTDPVTVRATRWQPHEVSVVSVPADPTAMVSLAGRQAFSALTGLSILEGKMTQKTDDTRSKPDDQTQVPPSADVLAAERKRSADILDACTRSGFPDKAKAYIEGGQTADQVRAALFEEMASKAPKIDVQIGGQDASNPLPRQLAMTAGVLARSNVPLKPETLARDGIAAAQISDMSRDYAGMTLLRMAEQSLMDAGVRTRGMSSMDIAKFALGLERAPGMMATSDFPIALGDAAGRSLRAAYDLQPQTWRKLVNIVPLSDFRPVKRVQVSEFDLLQKINEAGEYTSVAFGEAGETLQLGTFGRKTALTRQAIINDDLGIFSRIPRMFAAAAAMTEGNLVWGIVTGNPVMADGVTMFHASHANLAAVSAAPDVTSLSAMRQSIRMQKSLGGNPLNLAASMILAPPSLETLLEQLLAPLTRTLPTTTSDINPFAGKFEAVIEARLEAASATAWYGMVSPNTIDTIEVAYLNGQQGLYTESRVGFDVDGVEIKARLDIGAAPIDYRGFYKNNG